MAGLTRIPRRSLERLEAGAFDGNADGFARGFIRAVAQAIGVDPEEAGARLLNEVLPERVRRTWPWGPVALAVLAAALAFLGVRALSAFVRAPAPVAALASTLVRRDYVRELATRSPPAVAPTAAPAPAPPPEAALEAGPPATPAAP